MRQNLPRNQKVFAVVFTSGHQVSLKPDDRITMGKAAFVNRLQCLLQAGRLHLPFSQEAHALAGELRDYEIRVNRNGGARFGAFRRPTAAPKIDLVKVTSPETGVKLYKYSADR